MPSIVIPDDQPAVMGLASAYKQWVETHPVTYYDTLPGSEETLIERIRDFEVVVNIRSSTKFTGRVFAACPNMKQLSIWGTGTDNVDLHAAKRHGVTVTNTPGVAAMAIAEHCLMLTLAVARRVIPLHKQVVNGGWPRGQSIQLRGKTLGIVGLGAIGRQFAKLGEAIGMKVIAWTMHPNPALGFELVELDHLLRESDVISLHLRQSPQTAGFLNTSQFELMKQSAILINTARGPIVDEPALIAALRARRITGAGLDVFDTEPLPPGHPLTQLDNVVLTPHCAGVTPEVLEAGLALALTNVESYLSGSPRHVVSPA
ncbi:MAG: phosphoglycerate dehydrogenase [Acidobacteria bacterium]|nr:phosphoglycerate dehydrogenase [Acidobacteriota bacterium]